MGCIIRHTVQSSWLTPMTQSLHSSLVEQEESRRHALCWWKSLSGPKKLNARHLRSKNHRLLKMNTTSSIVSQDLRSSWQICEHSSQVVSTTTSRRLSLVTSHFWLSWKQVMLGSACTAWRIVQRRKGIILCLLWTQTETRPDWRVSQKIRFFTFACNVYHKDTARQGKALTTFAHLFASV